jgi:hypothetical protein
MAALNLSTIALDGGAVLDSIDTAAAAGGDTAPVGPNRALYVNNGGAGSVTVTVTTPGEVHSMAIADPTLTLAAGESGIIPLGKVFAGTNGRASISYSDVTSVTVAAIELEQD